MKTFSEIIAEFGSTKVTSKLSLLKKTSSFFRCCLVTFTILLLLFLGSEVRLHTAMG